MKRLVIVAGEPRATEFVRVVVRHATGLHVAGVLDARRSALPALLEARPDIVLVDDGAGTPSSLPRVREVDEMLPRPKVVVLTTRLEDEWVSQAFEAGADAVISRGVHPIALATLVRETANGNVFHFPASLNRQSDPADDCPLTPRELEILRLVAQGHTNGRIARGLWVTEQTVKFHLSNIYRKLDVTNRTEASRWAQLNGVLSSDEASVA